MKAYQIIGVVKTLNTDNQIVEVTEFDGLVNHIERVPDGVIIDGYSFKNSVIEVSYIRLVETNNPIRLHFANYAVNTNLKDRAKLIALTGAVMCHAFDALDSRNDYFDCVGREERYERPRGRDFDEYRDRQRVDPRPMRRHTRSNTSLDGLSHYLVAVLIDSIKSQPTVFRGFNSADCNINEFANTLCERAMVEIDREVEDVSLDVDALEELRKPKAPVAIPNSTQDWNNVACFVLVYYGKMAASDTVMAPDDVITDAIRAAKLSNVVDEVFKYSSVRLALRNSLSQALEYITIHGIKYKTNFLDNTTDIALGIVDLLFNTKAIDNIPDQKELLLKIAICQYLSVWYRLATKETVSFESAAALLLEGHKIEEHADYAIAALNARDGSARAVMLNIDSDLAMDCITASTASKESSIDAPTKAMWSEFRDILLNKKTAPKTAVDLMADAAVKLAVYRNSLFEKSEPVDEALLLKEFTELVKETYGFVSSKDTQELAKIFAEGVHKVTTEFDIRMISNKQIVHALYRMVTGRFKTMGVKK